jgi:LmbE family N-acetylglucosaminyl deacetylase
MRWIYISPHFDDAVLSCGGLIYEQAQQGIPVEIWTICAGDPPPGPLSVMALENHEVWDTGTAEETVALRREEDAAAAALVGAEIYLFDIPDCIYRRSPEGNLFYIDDVFAPLDPLEAGLSVEVAAVLAEELLSDDVIVCPLTIGNHMDHVMVRTAVEQLQRPVRYYADIPYLLNRPGALEPLTRGLTDESFPVSEKGLAAWLDGIAAYKSQIWMLFETEEKMRESIRAYWAGGNRPVLSEVEGIRLWRAG